MVTNAIPPIDAETARRFWNLVKKTDSGCWFFTGNKRSHEGYGYFVVRFDTPYGRARVNVAAHRLAYTLVKGPIPDGLLLRHSCDQPPCINPDHTIPGTGLENSRDAIERNRYRARRKVTDAIVGEIRRLYFEAEMTVGALAKRHGLSKPTIIRFVTGSARRQAPGPVGPLRITRGQKVYGAKLTEEKVAQLRARFIAGETIYDLAPVFDIAPQTVSNIIRNKTWRHVAPMPSVRIAPGHRKLTKEQVIKIRQRHTAGVSQRRLATDYGVSHATISMIVNRKTHAAE